MSKVTIVLATYNGARFIIEQLNSIFIQTRKPDEVLIIDDCSLDNTVSIIREYIEIHHLERDWKIRVNDYNKGYEQNFYDGICSAEGDFIFFCDQDDLWDFEKIEKMINIMEQN